jgi:hypothetical protein
MKEGTLHIHIVDLPSRTSYKGKNHSNIIHLCNRGKGLSVFDTFLLIKSLCNQERFMILNNTFKGKFGLVYPSTFHNVLPLRSRN